MRVWALALSLTLCASVASAQDLSKAETLFAHGDRAAALHIVEPLAGKNQPRALAILGRLYDAKGQHAQAEAAYRKVIALYNDDKIHDDDGEGLWAVAEAARGLGSFRDANDSFARAVKASPKNFDIELAWADLFLEKYDMKNAAVGLERVLEAEPENARALERLSRIRMEQGGDFTMVEDLLDRALKSDPKLQAAHVTRAAIGLHDEDLPRADRELDEALKLNPHDLEALSVRAAVRFVADDHAGFERAVSAVLKENPRYSRLFSIVGTYAEWEHRYQELVELGERALKIDPDDPYAHAMRALNLLRVGREKEGLTALEAAWQRDHYNVHVFNTLNLYDDVIAKEYELIDAPPFRIRVHKEEKKALLPYLEPMLKRAFEDMKKRYEFTPEGPISIELFANPEHFAVRTVGLPHIGVQGVCFGKVLTALSPRGGEFNWGQIVWHELSHVFHVQMAHSRVPRWFTEGLAEYETTRARAEWRREDDRPLWDALSENKLPALATMNHAFTHARSGEDLMIAYYASSLAVTYIVERFGFASMPKMLKLWAQDVPTDKVFSDALGIDLATLDRDFQTSLRARLQAKYEKDLRFDLTQYRDLDARKKAAELPTATPRDLGAYALALAVAGKTKEAEVTAAATLQKDPKEAQALFSRVHSALGRNQLPEAKQALDALIAQGHDGYQLRMLRARTEQRLEHVAAAFTELDAAVRIDPDRGEAFQLMAQLAERAQDEPRLVQALLRLSFLDQHTRGPLTQLLPLLEKRGDYAELAARAEAGLYLDPESSLVHRELAVGLLHTKDAKTARPEAERARDLAHDDEEKAKAEEVLSQLSGATPAPKAGAKAAPPSAPAREKKPVSR